MYQIINVLSKLVGFAKMWH